MSSSLPYCDSEEELFWGPITAREIELDWRRLNADRCNGVTSKDELISNEENLNNSTIENLNNSTIENISLRESTSSVISVKGDNRYEVYVPLTPINLKVAQGSTGAISVVTDPVNTDTNDFVEVNLNNDSLVNNDHQVEDSTHNLDKSGFEDTLKVIDSMDIQMGACKTASAIIDTDYKVNNSTFPQPTKEELHSPWHEKNAVSRTQMDLPEILTKTNSVYDNSFTQVMIKEQEPHEKMVNVLESQVESMKLNENDFSKNVENSGAVINPDSTHDITSTICIDEKNLKSNIMPFSKETEMCLDESSFYSPPGKKEKFNSNKLLKNKENENNSQLTKNKVPLPRPSKLPILKPSSLNIERNAKDETWSSEFKLKKVPKPKKPVYVVSPAKVGKLLKYDKNKLPRPLSAGSVNQKPLSTSLQTNTRLFNTPQLEKLSSAFKSTTPVSLKPPMKYNSEPRPKPITPPKNIMYKDVASPVADYINSSRTYIYGKRTPSTRAAKNPETPKESSPKVLCKQK